ncbi:MAG: argininosuccinate lyase [Acidobacteria bacterium RIFCSPLOWO2_12_FULL_67_14]|nr:MAG: argininosuccinate lyase [Acidobacteria bacterium RIFCSPLOWO2_02_FULL_67_21]OFW34733.1 MAG: argininosuccinate lyase [Acidobacteria bacterium RIFCSPLOWO2_12_FULL_67_14]
MTFDPEYADHVLSENFEDAKALFLPPLMAIHYAHLVMLADRGIVSAGEAHALRAALDAISIGDVRATPYDHACEDLFFHLDRLIQQGCGEEMAGRLHTARSRNDIDMTMYRLRVREYILALLDASLGLRDGLIAQAERHRTTLFAALTHTQPAQPSTLAHYLLAIIEQLERDAARLRAAFDSTNRCPLGACAITGTGFPIDRQLTSDLLGFHAPTGNTYGSIATVDYLLESVSAAAILLAGLGRVVQDLLLWGTREFGYLRLADGFVQASSIMPQKRNPVALEHARAIASKAVGEAGAVMLAVHNTPFGDVVDTEDDLQPLVASTFHDARRAVAVVDAALRAAEFDAARLESRAAEGGTTSTELADHLVREHRIPFMTAHAIAGRVLSACDKGSGETSQKRVREGGLGETLAAVSGDLLGVPLQYTDAQIAEILSPRHFVEVRRTLGGPAPVETARALVESHEALARDRSWLAETGERLTAARQQLRRRAEAL